MPRTVVITGASSGVGRAAARAFAARGDRVGLLAHNHDGLDAAALRAEVERALGAMEDVRRIKQQLTHAANGIESARGIVEELDRRVRSHLAQIDALLLPAVEDGE